MANRQDKPEGFASWEFACPCGCGRGYVHMDAGFIRRLKQARDEAGMPLIIMAAMRCMSHNFALGAEPGSAHLRGREIDLAIGGHGMRRNLIRALRLFGLKVMREEKGLVHVQAA